MSMNSFSSRSRNSKYKAMEEELSDLLNLHPEGESNQSTQLNTITHLSFRDIDREKLQKNWSDPQGRRVAQRHEVQLTVLVVTPNKSFRTQSENVSATGVLLRDILPEAIAQHKFEVVLIRTDDIGKKTFYIFRGHAVRSIPRTRRIQFDAMTAESEAKLQTLFKALSHNPEVTSA